MNVIELLTDFRDTVLNQRGALAENGMNGDQINDVLREFDMRLDALKAAAEQEPVAMVDVEDGGHSLELEYLEKLRKLPNGRYALYTHLIASEDKWKEAIWHECMMTEAVSPNEADPIGTIKRLVSYHVQLERAAQSVMTEWLPIETAPTDGAAVLVMRDIWPGTSTGRAEECNGLNTYVAQWWSGECGGKGAWICYMDQVQEPKCPIKPTHWMPLPAPPREGD